MTVGPHPARDTPVRISVIIPVHNAMAHLEQCLTALSHSTRGPDECLTVDDGSTDDSRGVAQRFGARVIALAGNRGPAFARNRGAEAATGEVLLFIDADVCVHPETVSQVAAVFSAHTDVAALIGSYDDAPGDPLFLSQYKNLFHHYVHQHGREAASTFWSGCGAVRRAVFLQMGGFDERYAVPCIEDIEFGCRLRRAGHRIRLAKEVQVKHLKRWRFLDLVRTDLFLRGVPWVGLMLRDRQMICDLNLGWHARVGTALTYLLAMALVALAGTGHPQAALAVPGVLGFGAMNALLYDRVTHAVGRWSAAIGLAAPACAVWAAGGIEPLTLLPASLLLALLGIHADFYRFWTRIRGIRFAVAVIPFHLLYFLYSGLAIPLGVLAYGRQRKGGRPVSAE
jgi:CTP:molybdopterin cytidylyltransferase MocA